MAMNKRQRKKALNKLFASKGMQDSMRAFAKVVLETRILDGYLIDDNHA